VTQPAPRLRCGHRDLLLRRGHNARALLADGRLDALLVFLALLLDLRAVLLNLCVQPGQLGLNGAQTGVGVGRGLARRLDVVAQRLGALAQHLRHYAHNRNHDGQQDDEEVDRLKDLCRGLNIHAHLLADLGHQRRVTIDVQLFLLVAGCRGRVFILSGLARTRTRTGRCGRSRILRRRVARQGKRRREQHRSQKNERKVPARRAWL
jgi:hypothetical protein